MRRMRIRILAASKRPQSKMKEKMPQDILIRATKRFREIQRCPRQAQSRKKTRLSIAPPTPSWSTYAPKPAIRTTYFQNCYLPWIADFTFSVVDSHVADKPEPNRIDDFELWYRHCRIYVEAPTSHFHEEGYGYGWVLSYQRMVILSTFAEPVECGSL